MNVVSRSARPDRPRDEAARVPAPVLPGARWRRSSATSLFARGEPMVWLLGGGLAICLAMIIGLLTFVLYQGLSTFWPGRLVQIQTVDGRVMMGETARAEAYAPEPGVFEQYSDEQRLAMQGVMDEGDGMVRRRLLRTGNFEISGEHFTWVSDFEIANDGETKPDWALVVERLSWGRFYGVPAAFVLDGERVATDPAEVWALYDQHHSDVRSRWRTRRALEKDEIGRINHELEAARLNLRAVELEQGTASPQWTAGREKLDALETGIQSEFARIRQEIERLNAENAKYQIVLVTADGQEKTIQLDEIVRAYPANRLGFTGRTGIYLGRWKEYLTDEPREANSEGGVFPAIFGTVVMTLLMSLAVVPFGVLAALYLREYAKAGPVVSAVRIAINNLAGVPSIVFGVFGLGFFSYIIGAQIDELLFAEKLPNPTYGTGGILWAATTLALLTLPVVIVATEEALAAVPNSMREGSYACGASKWQTIRRIVLPRAMPGVMTGMILAMARGAGEVAPLMLVGAVKLAPELPVDGFFPYVHLERSFMHLGFHIYDLGFQSQNSEASKPMVYTTTLLLIAIIFALNFTGVYLRARLRRKFASSVF